MQKLMISAAILALLTAPALAQHGHRDGGPPGGAPGHAPAAPRAAPAPQNHGPGRASGGMHGPSAMSGGMHGHPQPAPAAPRAAPAAQPQAHARPQPQAHARPQGGSHGNAHGNAGNNHRPGFNNNNRPGNRPNYSGFSRYHQNFNASRRFHAGSYHRPAGWYDRRWTFGQILPSLFWAQQYWLNDYMTYDLPPPPPGAVWVRNGNDALLIDRYSGEIITVEYSVFY